MLNDTRHTNPDLEFYTNNGTLALRVAATGRLKNIMHTLHDGTEKCWIFRQHTTWIDRETSESVFDHKTRGLTVGTWDEGMAFLEACESAGLRVNYSGFFVPISNGQRQYGKFEDRTPFCDYDRCEILRVRIDTPTVERFKRIAKIETPA